ncbi:MAG: efflux RND transporter periplasmic adaptor subunit [Treponema sp.]|nr:efflux RND transporter periplasmic adaptor subunit [Treponema sp.]MBP5751586.1 efflux RND transporter periplasmic adaptor subunit [Treponema sp.]
MKGNAGKKGALKFVLLFVFALTVVAAVVFISRRGGEKSSQTLDPIVKIERPKIQNISRTLVLPAYVEAKNMIPVIPLVSGTILEFPVEVGQQVNEGDVIARIDSEPFDGQVLQAKAAYLAYENSFARIANLYRSGNATAQNYDQAKASRDSAKAQYDLAVMQQGYATVRAKASGTVITVMSAQGSTAAQGQPLAVIADLSSLVVNLKVSEKYYPLIERNRDTLSLKVSQSGSDSSYDAVLGPIDPYVNPETKTFNMECRLDSDASLSLKPGMYVKVTVVYDEHRNVPVMPQSIRKTDGSVYIYQDGKAVFTDIKVELENDDFFMVDESHAQCDFIVDGQNSVFDGQTVRVLP